MENGGLMLGKNGNLSCLDRFSHSTVNSEEPFAEGLLNTIGQMTRIFQGTAAGALQNIAQPECPYRMPVFLFGSGLLLRPEGHGEFFQKFNPVALKFRVMDFAAHDEPRQLGKGHGKHGQ